MDVVDVLSERGCEKLKDSCVETRPASSSSSSLGYEFTTGATCQAEFTEHIRGARTILHCSGNLHECHTLRAANA